MGQITPSGDEIPLEWKVDALYFSPDSKTLAVNTSGVIFLVDAETARVKAPGIQGPETTTGADRPPGMTPLVGGVYELALDSMFSTDSKKLLVATRFTTQVWDAKKGVSLGRAQAFAPPTPGHTPGFNRAKGSVYWISSRQQTVHAPFQPTVQQQLPIVGIGWDPFSRKSIGKPLTLDADLMAANRERMVVEQIAFSPDGLLLALVHRNGWVRLFDWQKAKELAAGGLSPPQPNGSPNARVVWSPDGKRLLVNTAKAAQLWDPLALAKVGAAIAIPDFNNMPVDHLRWCANFSADSTRLVMPCSVPRFGSPHQEVQLIDAATGRQTSTFCPGEPRDFRKLAHLEFIGDDILVLPMEQARNGKPVPWLWDSLKALPKAQPTISSSQDRVAVSPDGKFLATVGSGPGGNRAAFGLRLWKLP